tara:strand:+ start:286 stop:450 length:165 start_codon:yes stop_codon:yes gene_type:complete
METLISKLSPKQIQALSVSFGRSEKQITNVLNKKGKIDLNKIFVNSKRKSSLKK